ncbi:putative reverse transcriptase domain-containing protein [Tanacetum coccineum]
MEAQFGKFLDMIRVVRINVPLINVLAGMPNYGKFLKELISNKHKIEQISAAFLSDETDLGASTNLMAYSLYAKLSLETLKPTHMSLRLADRSFQYPVGIAKNMLVEVGKFTFPADFVILEMEEDIIDVIDEILEEDFDALLDEEFDIEIKDRKGTENVAADHLSRIENDETSDDSEVDDTFTDEIIIGNNTKSIKCEVAVSMSWNEFKFMMIQEFCPSHEMQKLVSKLWNYAMVGVGHVAYTDRFHELARLDPHLITPESRMIERYISGALTDEAVRNGSIKKVEKRGNVGETSKDRSGRDDNMRTRTGNVFATIVNPVGRENMGVPRNVNPVNARNPTVRACYKCGSIDHGRGNQGNQARGRAFMLGAEEACQDPNIVTGLELSDLGFRYEIEIATGQLVEINKVIKGCKLEIKSHVFDINLIPFGHGSFDMIIGIDWLSNYKAKIIYHEKVVRIPLSDGKVLRVVGERPEEKARLLMSVKASDKKQEEIVVVRDFPEVFPDDLSGLLPIREIKFQIELIPGATPVAKSPYRLAPSEMEELFGQLKEL